RSASLLGDDLDKRRDELRATLPNRRVVGPADVAALAVHIMSNTALTGATYDVDGGQQLVAGRKDLDNARRHRTRRHVPRLRAPGSHESPSAAQRAAGLRSTDAPACPR